MAEPDTLRRRVEAITNWYHVLRLPSGITTRGAYDMAPHLDALGIPDSMEGLQVLDVGAADGFFSFEFERRGARQVVAVELPSVVDHEAPRWFLEEWLAGRTPQEILQVDRDELEVRFELAHEVFESRVERRRCTVGSLGTTMPGEFDLAFCCNLLQHLRDPVDALENVRETLRPGGRLILGAPCDERAAGSYAVFLGSLEPHLTWWIPSPEALLRMCTLAGFEDVEWMGSFELSVADSVDGPGATGTVGVLHARAR